MVTTAVLTASTSVLCRERRNCSSPRTVVQFSSVHGSGMWKKPNSFMNVPSSAKTTGTPSTRRTRARARSMAGARHAPSAWTRLWNWPVTVV